MVSKLLVSCNSILYLLVQLFASPVYAYNQTSCCLTANDAGMLQNKEGYIFKSTTCGQSYDPDEDAAPDAWVSFDYCWSECGGIGLSQGSEPGQWAAPIVQFILPAIIFSTTIPRRKYLSLFPDTQSQSKSTIVRIVCRILMAFIVLLPITLDTIIWICTIIASASAFLVGGLYEMYLDRLTINYIWQKQNAAKRAATNTVATGTSAEGLTTSLTTGSTTGSTTSNSVRNNNIVSIVTENVLISSNGTQIVTDAREETEATVELLVILACGNLLDIGSPIEEITRSLPYPDDEQQKDKNSIRLQSLIGAQSNFGSAVGVPVLFYLGAFIYTILDLSSDPSNQDSSISLAYGVEWMVIVHIAIISGCLLAANNPATSTAIAAGMRRQGSDDVSNRFRHKHTKFCDFKYSMCDMWFFVIKTIFSNTSGTTFQPVWMWRRGANKRMWLKKSRAFEGIPRPRPWALGSWWFYIGASTIILIALPAAAGAVVSHETPPVGFSCRSLSFMVYAGSQIVLCICYILRTALLHEYDGEYTFNNKRLPKWLKWSRWPVNVLFFKVWTTRWANVLPIFFSLLACVGATAMQVVGVYRNCFCYVLANHWIDLPNARVNLASDTEEARRVNGSWIKMGGSATVFMAVMAYVGWLYQDYSRKRYLDIVNNLYSHLPPSAISAAPIDTIANSSDHSVSSTSGDAPDSSIIPMITIRCGSHRSSISGDLESW